MKLRSFLLLVWVVYTPACGDDTFSLTVDLRSDALAGLELSGVRLSLEGEIGPPLQYAVQPGDLLREGLRLGSFESLAAGSYVLRSEFLSPQGMLGLRRTVVLVSRDTVVTTVFSEACRAISCPVADGDPGATECNNGRCASPECTPESPEACGDSRCVSAADCPASEVGCANAACLTGLCFFVPTAGACGSNEVCSPSEGCVLENGADAGLVDAGVMDSGPDMPPADAGGGCDNHDDCSDGVYCNGEEQCVAGLCRNAERDVLCDDGVLCTSDRCDNDVAACVFSAEDGLCDADVGGRCVVEMGGCQYPTCNRSTCTAGPCQTAECQGDRCVRTNLCSGGQMCCNGACVAAGCDDGNACTSDSCGAAGCTHIPNTSICDDGNMCTVSDRCGGGVCTGSPRVCNDDNACTADSCITTSGCRFTNTTVPCDDGDGCTVGDRCGGGVCGGTARTCDDSEPCTTDSCSAGDCQFVNNTEVCNDGNACTVSDRCAAGVCGGTPRVCNDDDVCTTDSCDTGSGCRFTNNTAACNDNDACTVSDQCSGGTCQGGGALNCNDDNACTADGCDSATGCTHTNQPDGRLCGPCRECLAGSCGSGCEPGFHCCEATMCIPTGMSCF